MSYLRHLCLFAYSGVQHILTIRVSCGRKKLLALCMRLGWYQDNSIPGHLGTEHRYDNVTLIPLVRVTNRSHST
jgi:hypothetical protein